MAPLIRYVALLLALPACERQGTVSQAKCGLAMVAGPTTLLSQFTVAGQTLSEAPRNLPERLVARYVADGAFPAVVGRTDSLLVIGVDATLPEKARPGFGVLVVDPTEKARGVVIFEGDPVEGAPRLGDVSVGAATVPLIGVQVDPARIEDANCPFFPDSVIQ
jgi:hypothetical protein